MKRPKFGVAVFPGSNCDYDAYDALIYLGMDTEFVWHEEKNLSKFDALILPGGFSYGDYLRTGAIAKFSPLMQSLYDFVEKGRIVIGICNGFQILLESGILPGAMLVNRDLKFVCKTVNIRVERQDTIFTSEMKKGEILRIPIAHHSGNYFVDSQTLEEIERNGQVLFRYCDDEGNINDKANPNGSLNNIAGIINKKGNVLGLMPHPERACESVLGSEDGRKIFLSIHRNILSAVI